jgi:hypothetical protein
MSCTCGVSIWYSESQWGTLNLLNLQFLKLTILIFVLLHFSLYFLSPAKWVHFLADNTDFDCSLSGSSAILPYINFLSLIKKVTKIWGVQLLHDKAGNTTLSRHHLNFHNFLFLLYTPAQPLCTSGH